MSFGCPICCERLDRPPGQRVPGTGAQEDVNIAAIPCGHIFHTFCVQKWLTGNLASSKNCPCCRKEVPKLTVLPLYPNQHDSLDDTYSILQGGDCDHSHFNKQISDLKKLVESNQDRVKEAELMIEIQVSETTEFKRKYETEKVKSERYLYQCRQAESYKTFSEEKNKECENLKSLLKKYQIIESLVRNVEDDVTYELESYGPNMESIKSLLEIHLTFKQEFQNVNKKLANTKKQQESDRLEMAKLKRRYEDLLRDHSELKRVHDASIVETPDRGSSYGKPGILEVMHTTRTPLTTGMTHTKLKKSKSQEMLTRDVDEDVPVMQPFGKRLKRGNYVDKAKSQVPRFDQVCKHYNLQSKLDRLDGIKRDDDDNDSTSSSDFIAATPALSRKMKTPEEFKLAKRNATKSNPMEVSGSSNNKSEAKKFKLNQAFVIPPAATASSSKDLMTNLGQNKTKPCTATSTSTTEFNSLSEARQNATKKKIGRLTNFEVIDLMNDTIVLSDEEDTPLRGNIPGMKITPRIRPDLKNVEKPPKKFTFKSKK